MKRMLIAVLVALTSSLHAGESKDGALILTGNFVRKGQTEEHDLKATLTPEDSGKWKVVYDFVWGKKPTQYLGTVTGDIKNGSFEGVAANQGEKRTWKIKGVAKNGVLTFDHWETTGGKESPTGKAMLQ
jgi:hypothetical protein